MTKTPEEGIIAIVTLVTAIVCVVTPIVTVITIEQWERDNSSIENQRVTRDTTIDSTRGAVRIVI